MLQVTYQALQNDATLGSPDSPHNITDPTKSSITISGLTPNSDYNISVCAYTSVGCGENTNDTSLTSEDG